MALEVEVEVEVEIEIAVTARVRHAVGHAVRTSGESTSVDFYSIGGFAGGTSEGNGRFIVSELVGGERRDLE